MSNSPTSVTRKRSIIIAASTALLAPATVSVSTADVSTIVDASAVNSPTKFDTAAAAAERVRGAVENGVAVELKQLVMHLNSSAATLQAV